MFTCATTNLKMAESMKIALPIRQRTIEAMFQQVTGGILDEEDRKKAIVMCMAICSHMQRCQQLLSIWNTLIKQLELIITDRVGSRSVASVQYCLPRKGKLLLRHLITEPHYLRKHCRVSRATFQQVCTLVHSGKDHGWPEKLEVLVLLYWLATGASYRVVADKFGMPKSTVNDLIHRMLLKLLHNLNHVVFLPGVNEAETIGQGFAELAGASSFNHTAGCLDCFHVGIKPPKTMEQYYANEKLYYSIKCQIVCDHRGLIRDIFVGFPGSVRDAQVFRLSPLYSKRNFPPSEYTLLADNAYPSMDRPLKILTPFPNPKANTLESTFNATHTKAWIVVHKTINRMKLRWHRIFNQKLDASNRLAPKVVTACAILHNIALQNGDVMETVMEHTNIVMDKANHPNENSSFRALLANNLAKCLSTPTPIDHCYL